MSRLGLNNETKKRKANYEDVTIVIGNILNKLDFVEHKKQ